jgi:hypothetical protein
MGAGPGKPAITPDLKVGELLDAYPELEDELIEIAPAFKKLRNPVLRRTIAKLTSLRQAAQVGGVSLGNIISRLRCAAGIKEIWMDHEGTLQNGASAPDWVGGGEVVETLDAIEMIEGGAHPLPQVMSALNKLRSGQVYAIVTPFVPAPMIDKAREAGYQSWTEQLKPERFKTYFIKPPSKDQTR